MERGFSTHRAKRTYFVWTAIRVHAGDHRTIVVPTITSLNPDTWTSGLYMDTNITSKTCCSNPRRVRTDDVDPGERQTWLGPRLITVVRGLEWLFPEFFPFASGLRFSTMVE